MKNSVWETIKGQLSLNLLFLILATAVVLLLGGVLGTLSADVNMAVTGIVIMALIIAFHQDQLAVTVVIAVHIYVDWYMGLHFVAPVMVLALLCIFFLRRSPQYPWVEPRALWLWLLFLVVALFPVPRGLNLHDGETYYITIIFSALTVFWLGLVVGRDVASIRRLFEFLAVFGILMAIHTTIQGLTGITLFKVIPPGAIPKDPSFFEIVGTGLSRVEGFFLHPDTNGTFFATVLFLPLGLLVHSSSLLKKVFYLAGVFIMLLALLFTYTTASLAAALAGVFCFLVFVGRSGYRFLIPLLVFIAALAIVVAFPSQVAAQLQHFGDSYEWPLRTGAWLTALNVIRAFPLTGLGMGDTVYIVRSDPYRVPDQFIPLYHPHNSYLEFATQGGLPLMVIFLAVLASALWQAWHNWASAKIGTRSLLAAGLTTVLTLCFNSLINPGWTIAPLASIGWLILGAISSPLLAKSLNGPMKEERSESDV